MLALFGLVILALFHDEFIKSVMKDKKITIMVNFTVDMVGPAMFLTVWMGLFEFPDFWRWVWR